MRATNSTYVSLKHLSGLIIGCCLLLLSACSEHNDNFPGFPESALKPQATNVALTPDAGAVDTTLEGTYDLEDAEGEGEGTSIYRWLIDDVPIKDATGTTYIIGPTATDTNGNDIPTPGTTIKFCVTPVSAYGVKGEEVCIATKVPIAADPPAALNVAVGPNPATVGGQLTGTYTFSFADTYSSGADASTFRWLVNGAEIAGEHDTSLTLSNDLTDTTGNPVNLVGQVVQFCVTPNTSDGIKGKEVCADTTAILAGIPTVSNVAITPDPLYTTVNATGTYTFSDPNGGTDASTYRWNKIDSGGTRTPIAGQTTTTLDLDAVGIAAGEKVEFCVTPVNNSGVSGVEFCTTSLTAVITGTPPSVSPTPDLQIGSGGLDAPTEGQTLTGTYTYVPGNDNLPEGGSTVVWKVNGVVDAGTPCTAGTACNFTIAPGNIGQTIEFCVTPINTLGVAGTEVCSTQITGSKISLVGKLTYTRTLTATVVGFTGTYEWRIDQDDTTGPQADTNKTIAFGSTNSLTYQIGSQPTVPVNGVNDSNSNGAIDDHDWFSGAFTLPVVDARHFIGKDVEFCVITAEYGDQCVLASTFQASATTVCTDDTLCVINGIYYDYPSITARGIEPRRIATKVGAANFMSLHRPITLDEMQFSADGILSYGTGLPAQDATTTIGGIEYPLFNHGDPTAVRKPVSFCLAFTAYDHVSDAAVSDWSLPTATNANSTDEYSGAPNFNTSPAGAGMNIENHASSIFRQDAGSTYELSPAFGWPLSVPYWNAYWTALLGIYETNLGDTGAGPVVALAGDQNLVGCFRDTGVP